MLDNTTITIIAVVIIICFLGIYIFVYRSDVKEIKKAEKQPALDKSLQLQAHERLTILAERLALKNLVARIAPAGMTADTYQRLLVETIKQEYDYNLSQQLYVSPQVWQAIPTLKEQNISLSINWQIHSRREHPGPIFVSVYSNCWMRIPRLHCIPWSLKRFVLMPKR